MYMTKHDFFENTYPGYKARMRNLFGPNETNWNIIYVTNWRMNWPDSLNLIKIDSMVDARTLACQLSIMPTFYQLFRNSIVFYFDEDFMLFKLAYQPTSTIA